MRSNSRVAAGSPTVRAMAILVATLLLIAAMAAAGAGAQRLLASDGEIVVDQAGCGDFTTITDALSAAEDGDQILVRAGTYVESITVDKGITLRGEDRDSVILEPAGEVVVTVIESDGEIADLTLLGEGATQGMSVQGGTPTIANVVFDGTDRPFSDICFETECGGSLALEGADAHVIGNLFLEGGEVGLHAEGTAIIEDNVFEGGPHIYLESIGPDVVVRGNRISGTLNRGIGLSSPGDPVIEGNHVSPAEGVSIRVGQNTGAEGYEPTIRGNTIEGADYGIEVTEGGAPSIEGNTFHGSNVAIQATLATSNITGDTLTDNNTGLSLGSEDHTVTGNSITGGRTGIVTTGGSAQLSGNTVEGASDRGIAIGGDATALLRDNRACGNGENLWVADAANPDIDDSNEICQDGLTE